MDYDTCETSFGYTECTYFRDKGDHSITVIQQITPVYINYRVYCSGIYDGVDYGSMYLLQEQFINTNGKFFSFELFRPPSPPESANQRYYSFECWIFDAESTIYTPWGIFSDQEIVFKSAGYMWDPTTNDNRPFCGSKMSFKGSILNLMLYAWSFKNEVLFLFWTACWDFSSHEGTWISADEDGNIQRTGPM